MDYDDCIEMLIDLNVLDKDGLFFTDEYTEYMNSETSAKNIKVLYLTGKMASDYLLHNEGLDMDERGIAAYILNYCLAEYNPAFKRLPTYIRMDITTILSVRTETLNAMLGGTFDKSEM